MIVKIIHEDKTCKAESMIEISIGDSNISLYAII